MLCLLMCREHHLPPACCAKKPTVIGKENLWCALILYGWVGLDLELFSEGRWTEAPSNTKIALPQTVALRPSLQQWKGCGRSARGVHSHLKSVKETKTPHAGINSRQDVEYQWQIFPTKVAECIGFVPIYDPEICVQFAPSIQHPPNHDPKVQG